MVEPTGQGDVDLHRVQVSIILGARAGVEQQAPLQRCQRQHVSDFVSALQLFEFLGGYGDQRKIRGGESAPAVAHVRADAGQGLEPQPTQHIYLRCIDFRGRPRPGGLQPRPGDGVQRDDIDPYGMAERHRPSCT